MEGFTLIDGVVALVIVLSAILAYSRGFVREAMAIVGWIGGVWFVTLVVMPAITRRPGGSRPRSIPYCTRKTPAAAKDTAATA